MHAGILWPPTMRNTTMTTDPKFCGYCAAPITTTYSDDGNNTLFRTIFHEVDCPTLEEDYDPDTIQFG